MAGQLHYTDIMGNYNSKSQYLCSDLVTVHFTDPTGRKMRTTANLEEIAPNSLCLLVDSRIAAGSRTTIELKGLILRGQAGKVEHNQCLGYFVEVRLAPDSRWSRERYTPAHMLPSANSQEPTFCRHRPATKVNA